MNSYTASCLRLVQMVFARGKISRAVLVRVSVDRGTVMTACAARIGEVFVVACHLDGHPVKAAAVVTATGPGEITFRFAAMPAEARAHLARFVYGQLRRERIQERNPRAPLKVRSVAFPGPSVRKTVSAGGPRESHGDWHRPPSARWLARRPVETTGVIAPRNR